MDSVDVRIIVSDVIDALGCLGTANAKVVTVADGVEWNEALGSMRVVASSLRLLPEVFDSALP